MQMTLQKAKEILKEFAENTNRTKEDMARAREALRVLLAQVAVTPG